MTDLDILRFANMPRYSQRNTDYNLAMEAFAPIEQCVDEICKYTDQLDILTTAQKKIYKHGLTPFIIEEYEDTLASYSINFKTQSVHACLEGLTSIVERIWVAIKNGLSRLIEFLKTNPYFAQWFNRCEFYRSRMASIISGPLKNYVKADINAFNSRTLSGWNYTDFCARTEYVGRLITKLKSVTSYRMESLDIQSVFYDVFRGLNIPYENDSITIVNPQFTLTTAYALGWNPFKVYAISSSLYSKVAVNSMTLTRMQREFERQLNMAILECNNVLSGREDGNDELKVQNARRRIKNIKNIQSLVQIAVSNTCLLCGQWCKLASSFDIGQRPYPA